MVEKSEEDGQGKSKKIDRSWGRVERAVDRRRCKRPAAGNESVDDCTMAGNYESGRWMVERAEWMEDGRTGRR